MRSIAEQIRDALTKRDGISKLEMQPLAEAYAAEVTRVNGRLAAAASLLGKGLRSEAIQNASIAPNAIDDAAKLDFPEIDEWCDILQFLGVPVPPTLMRDLADQLNEAIVDIQPLESLLQKHRRLAIARAPLDWRLKTLRRIAQLDALNAYWNEDIESWERIRHKQIAALTSAAIAVGDLPALRALQDELTSAPWRVAAEPSTQKTVNEAVAELSRSETLAQLEQTATELHDAFCQFDEPAARRAISRWNQLSATLGDAVPEPLAEQADGAIQWIAELDREATERAERGVAIGELEAGLDRGAPLHDLERAYHAATTFDPPPPEELIQRYEVAVEERRLAKQRKFQATIGGIVAAALIAIGALAWWQFQAARQARVVAAHKEFQTLLDTPDLDGAQAFYRALAAADAGTAAAPAVAALYARMEGLLDAERQRLDEFSRHLQAADADAPADIDLEALARAEDLAASDSEREKAFQLRRRRQQWEADITARESSELLAQLAKLQERLDKIESSDPDERALGALAAVLADLDSLYNGFPRADASARFQVNSARTRAMSMRSAVHARIERSRAEQEALAAVLSAASLDHLARSLERFAQQSPMSPLAAEFAAVAAERPLWTAAAAWNEYAESAATAIAGGLVAADMMRYDDARAAMEAVASNSVASLPATALARLDRRNERREILERVLGGLTDTVIADLYTVVESEGSGDRYFTYKSYYESNKSRFDAFPAQAQVKIRGLDVVANDSGAVENHGLRGNYLVNHEPHATIQWLLNEHRAKQPQFLTDWEGNFLRLAAEVHHRRDLDGQIKEMLLQHLLAGAAEGSDSLADELIDALLWLKNHAAARATWYLPRPFDSAAPDEVEEAILPHLARLYRSRTMPRDDVDSIRGQTCAWVGLITRQADGKHSMYCIQQSVQNGRLAIVRGTAGAADHAEWAVVGTIRSGETILTAAPGELVAGRPVFLYPE